MIDDLTKAFSPSFWANGESNNEDDRAEVMRGFYEGTSKAHKDVSENESIARTINMRYGLKDRQYFDVWGDVDDRMVIFFHGGYWMEGDRKDCLTPYKAALDAGFAFATLSYRYVGRKYNFEDCISDAVKGVRCLLRKYPGVSKFIIGGHSAGALLAYQAVVYVRDPRIKGLLSVGGVYFLQELSQTEIGDDLDLSKDDAVKYECDVSRLNGLNIKTQFIYGLLEAPKLIEQNRLFKMARPEVLVEEIPTDSHYTVMTNMLDNTTPAYQAVHRYLKLF